MKAATVTDTTTQLTRFGFVNAYLVREDDGLTLVDTTMKAADPILAAAQRIGAPIRRIALTHGHTDHTGSLDALKARLGAGVEVLLPETDARILADAGGKKPKGSWPKLETKPDILLAPGDRVGSLEVVASPGHTPGHVSFLDTRDRTLIGGDVFTSFGGVEVTNHLYWRFPLAAMATEDKAQDLASARTLRALEPRLLLVGHGPPARDPAAAMDRAISRATT
jgi:glyoxylase-like metal-dependent hydrolase (beta-lactamase superfamily II)